MHNRITANYNSSKPELPFYLRHFQSQTQIDSKATMLKLLFLTLATLFITLSSQNAPKARRLLGDQQALALIEEKEKRITELRAEFTRNMGRGMAILEEFYKTQKEIAELWREAHKDK